MSVVVSIWKDEQTSKEVVKRFENASRARRPYEDRWSRNEISVYNTSPGALTQGLAGLLGLDQEDTIDNSMVESSTAYTFKNFRLIHAQMSSNPPTVAMQPQTSDQDDKRKALAADRIARYATRQYNLQEMIDQQSLQTLLYGIGVMKIIWDSTLGEILSQDPKTMEVVLEGDISVSVPFIWNLYLDPDARSAQEVKWVIEEIYLDYDEACARYPKSRDALEKARVPSGTQGKKGSRGNSSSAGSNLDTEHYNSVRLLEYWEKGLPSNGYLGRHAIVTPEGKIVRPCGPSPQRFRQSGKEWALTQNGKLSEEQRVSEIAKIPEKADLPYHILTDIDVPNTVWGKSMVEYAAQLQDNLNSMDSGVLDNVRAHGAARLVVPESAEMPDDAITDSTWDVVRIAGNQPPYFMSPPSTLPDMTNSRAQHVEGINVVMGVNEAMDGNQSRETSGASMQFAVNQGNMVRRRLFNKYTLVVEAEYKTILNLVRKHWVTGKIIHVLGKENALDAVEVKGLDIDGGYDVRCEYGTHFSLDPITRQQQIMTMQPLLEKAGIPARTSLKLMRMAEMEGAYDRIELAGNRQKEIFDEMVAKEILIPPEDLMDHENMVSWAFDYFMTAEFSSLPQEIRLLLKEHTKMRIALAAQEKAGMSGGQPAQVQPAAVQAPVDPAGAPAVLPPVA